MQRRPASNPPHTVTEIKNGSFLRKTTEKQKRKRHERPRACLGRRNIFPKKNDPSGLPSIRNPRIGEKLERCCQSTCWPSSFVFRHLGSTAVPQSGPAGRPRSSQQLSRPSAHKVEAGASWALSF